MSHKPTAALSHHRTYGPPRPFGYGAGSIRRFVEQYNRSFHQLHLASFPSKRMVCRRESVTHNRQVPCFAGRPLFDVQPFTATLSRSAASNNLSRTQSVGMASHWSNPAASTSNELLPAGFDMLCCLTLHY